MHSLIKNRNQLVAHGLKTGRDHALDIVTAALEGVNAYKAVMNKVGLVGDVLKKPAGRYLSLPGKPGQMTL